MPEQETLERARADKREGKSPSTQAGEFVREEIHNVRKGIHGARSAKQVIAIGLSKARRAGVKLPLPRKGSLPEQTRRQALREMEQGRHQPDKKPSPTRSHAVLQSLRRENTVARPLQHSHAMRSKVPGKKPPLNVQQQLERRRERA